MRLRIKEKETEKEILSSLSYIYSFEKADKIIAEELLKTYKKDFGKRKFVDWNTDESVLVVLFYLSEQKDLPIIGFKLWLIQQPTEVDLNFGNTFCRVYNDDTNLFPDAEKYKSQWISFRQTQFRRAIATFSAFSTEPMISWLQTVENSTSLTYEGQPFTFCLFMTKQKKWIQQPLQKEFLEFSNSISFEKAILNEKWVRAITSKNISLVGLGLTGKIIGMFNIPMSKKNEKITLSPHENIESITKTLVPGTCVFLTTMHGDIYFMLPNNSTFLKTQGRWYYLNYNNILSVLSNDLEIDVATSILRLALNLSFDRLGAMIAIPSEEKDVQNMVPDYQGKNRANQDLRSSIEGLEVTDNIHRTLIGAAAKVDGAILISSKGKILDSACMISEPKKEQLEKIGVKKLERFSGARTTAAWNASIYGISIKVSEDGPITIFKHGKIISKMG